MNKKAAVKKVHSTSKPSKRGGRPGVDIESLMVKVMYEAPKALTDKELAKFLGIVESTFYDYKAHHAEFAEVIKHYKKISPIEVLGSFKKIAVGYTYDEKVKELQKNSKTGKYNLVVTKITTKYVQPSATAGIFYLKNQMPEQFKDRVEQVHSFGSGALENITLVIKGRD